jgi:uncharacterized protein (DUF433 family)
MTDCVLLTSETIGSRWMGNSVGRFIVANPKICQGKPTFRGTRILVADVLEQVATGMAWTAIVDEWEGRVSTAAVGEAVRLANQAFLSKYATVTADARTAVESNSYWSVLKANTIFLSPQVVEGFAALFGDAVVAPVAFRGTRDDSDLLSGGIVFRNGNAYAAWSMRPSRNACSAALGFKPGHLERCKTRVLVVTCENGQSVERRWNVHHVHECSASASIAEKCTYFTNLANLVLVSEVVHRDCSSFVHGVQPGARWLKWVVQQLYPVASQKFPSSAKPDGAPELSDILIAATNDAAIERLERMRRELPAGSAAATRRWRNAALHENQRDASP